MSIPSGGDLIADVLVAEGVRTLFTLCGGHIAPILVSARQRGLAVVDTRHEAAAVFAADAEARLRGIPGVAAVTAGPGITNTITALKNAQLAASPLVVLCGATATVLRGRGSLQDIDQESLVLPHVKWFASARQVRELAPLVREAFEQARRGVPGPTCVECPLDLLYEEPVVRTWYGLEGPRPSTIGARLQQSYLRWHLSRVFAGMGTDDPKRRPRHPGDAPLPTRFAPTSAEVKAIARRLERARRPLLLIGSQGLVAPGEAADLAAAVRSLAVPTYLSGMARGLLGAADSLQLRHQRKQALRDADLVILAGVPCDFRLDYGRHISARAAVVALNRDPSELRRNRTPTLGVQADPDLVLRAVARRHGHDDRSDRARPWADWLTTLRERDAARDLDIAERARQSAPPINPLALCQAIDAHLADDSVLVADGGDFVGTASYVIRPRRPLSWLDPGVFGTLGVGGGFVLGAHAARPGAEIWVIYGDGAAGYSLAEFDTFVRHRIPVIAVVGNDASWAQIAREQVEILGESTGTDLRRSDYHLVAEGFGGRGLLLDRQEAVAETLEEARALARQGHAVLVNALLGKTDFRKGSISL